MKQLSKKLYILQYIEIIILLLLIIGGHSILCYFEVNFNYFLTATQIRFKSIYNFILLLPFLSSLSTFMSNQDHMLFQFEPSPTKSLHQLQLHLEQNSKDEHNSQYLCKNGGHYDSNSSYMQNQHFLWKQGSQKLGNDNSLPRSNRIQFNTENYERFGYLIWGKYQVLRNVTDFNRLFRQIQFEAKIQSISLSFDRKIPKEHKGAIFKLIDPQQLKLYQATILLLSHLFEVQNTSNCYSQQFSMTILVPRMLVPVMMGKQGKIISKIKNITNCNILVHGPYRGYTYQNIQLTSTQISNLAKSCYLIYNTVYKTLRKQQINIDSSLVMRNEKIFTIGLQIDIEIYRKVILQYEGLVEDAMRENLVQVQTVKCLKQIDMYGGQNYEFMYKITGKMDGVKNMLCFILKLLDFERQLEPSLNLIIMKKTAKQIKGFSGKILRDISSKSQYCYIEVKEKNQYLNRLVIKGDYEGMVKASCLAIQFVCFANQITTLERKKEFIRHHEEIDNFVEPFSYQNEESLRKSQFNGLKTKAIKKKAKFQKSNKKVQKLPNIQSLNIKEKKTDEENDKQNHLFSPLKHRMIY